MKDDISSKTFAYWFQKDVFKAIQFVKTAGLGL